MKLPRRKFLHLAAGGAALPAVSRFAWAQAYPARPVTMIVPFAPGGATDVVGRIVGEYLSRALGQQFVIENVAGAGGTIASHLLSYVPGVSSVPTGPPSIGPNRGPTPRTTPRRSRRRCSSSMAARTASCRFRAACGSSNIFRTPGSTVSGNVATGPRSSSTTGSSPRFADSCPAGCDF